MIIEIINKLKATTSTIEKIAILKQAKLSLSSFAEQELKNILLATYNPYKVYHLKFPEVRTETATGFYPFAGFELLERLANQAGATMRDKQEVRNFCSTNGNLLMKIINKSLDCGISATTINKVWPGLIPQFKVQLAKEVPLSTLKFPLLCQTKYDGVRLLAFKSLYGAVQLYTRNGKKVNYPSLCKALEKTMLPGTVLDGELVSTARTNISGLVNSALKGGIITKEQEQSHKINYCIFDSLLLDQFNVQKCMTPYKDRYDSIPLNLEAPLRKVSSTLVHSIEEVQTVYKQKIEQGLEGVILKTEKHLYSFKRSKDWVKLKEIKDCDLLCIDVIEGEGKYSGMIGALLCTGVVEDQNVIVKVGSGLSDMERSKPHLYYKGSKIKIKYNEIIKDSSTNKWSLFLPRFVERRFDK